MIMSVQQLGFKKPSVRIVRRLIMNIVGREKSGKTHLAFTAPGPIAVIDFDYGMEGVIDKFSDKEILVSEYKMDVVDAEKAKSEWVRYKKEFLGAIKDPRIRTIITDTGTEMWELARLAAFGKLLQVKAHHYAPVNAEVRSLIRSAYGADKNVIFLNKMTEKYVNEQATGQFVMAGFKDLPYACQINLLTWREVGGGFHAEVTECRHDPTLVGMDFESDLQEGGVDMMNFKTIAMTIFPNSKEEEWE